MKSPAELAACPEFGSRVYCSTSPTASGLVRRRSPTAIQDLGIARREAMLGILDWDQLGVHACARAARDHSPHAPLAVAVSVGR